MNGYQFLSPEIAEKIREDRVMEQFNPNGTEEAEALRAQAQKTGPEIWRPAYAVDCEKILHLPYYNRYADKTQVFSFYHNDDLTHRGLHVQLVSRSAKTIGRVLGLNLDLIEAIALGHDLGHAPFGHVGERYLDELFYAHTKRHFAHHLQGVRILHHVFRRNLTLQTLDGILCHNGEMPLGKYQPQPLEGFPSLEDRLDRCERLGEEETKKLIPGTPEGCLVRMCDLIAYLGKDRQDAVAARIVGSEKEFKETMLGANNAEMIHNISVDLIKQSYGKPYLRLSEGVYQALLAVMKENYEKIYRASAITERYDRELRPLFSMLYEKLREDAVSGAENTWIAKHHIDLVNRYRRYADQPEDYQEEDPDRIVTDYIASMTDDYFLDLVEKLFPGQGRLPFVSYFEK